MLKFVLRVVGFWVATPCGLLSGSSLSDMVLPSTLNVEAVCLAEMYLCVYHTRRCLNPKDHNMNRHRGEKRISYMYTVVNVLITVNKKGKAVSL
jgi:hypothetical protein